MPGLHLRCEVRSFVGGLELLLNDLFGRGGVLRNVANVILLKLFQFRELRGESLLLAIDLEVLLQLLTWDLILLSGFLIYLVEHGLQAQQFRGVPS